jgi:hypothetical protein
MSVDYHLKQELIASAQETIDWPLNHSLKFKSISYLRKDYGST